MLGEKLGQSAIVDNRGGDGDGGGMIGAQLVTKISADGYTVMVVTSA
jgi:tripartite-type tricarboxylate transporter receptor subunit TctC